MSNENVRMNGCICVRQTSKAYLIETISNSIQDWLPKSMISVDETGENENGEKIIEIVLPKWLAEERGFEFEEIE